MKHLLVVTLPTFNSGKKIGEWTYEIEAENEFSWGIYSASFRSENSDVRSCEDLVLKAENTQQMITETLRRHFLNLRIKNEDKEPQPLTFLEQQMENEKELIEDFKRYN